MRKTIVFGVVVFCCFTAVAQDAPSVGLMHNASESHSITYRCEPVRNGQLNCEFVQTAVRFKSTLAKLPEAIYNASKQFKTEQPPSAQDCALFKDILDIIEGRKVAPKPEAIGAMTPVVKQDALRSAKLFLTYCAKPTEENYLALTRFTQDKDRRTCNVSSFSFKQTFRQAEPGNKVSAWVTQSTPDGPCGFVQLSRLEPEETKIGQSTFVNWKYIARKAITNPNGELVPGTKCSGFDENPYLYDWRSKENQMSCDYIVFTPL
jgi:hypothetical protein